MNTVTLEFPLDALASPGVSPASLASEAKFPTPGHALIFYKMQAKPLTYNQMLFSLKIVELDIELECLIGKNDSEDNQYNLSCFQFGDFWWAKIRFGLYSSRYTRFTRCEMPVKIS